MSFQKNIPTKLKSIVDRELKAGERVRWMEMPIPRYFTPASIGAFLFAIPWTAFAIFWICAASGFQLPDFSSPTSLFPLFGVPFVLIGIGMLSSPFWVYRNSFKTIYVITDQRAITFNGGWSTTIRSFTPENLKDVYRKEKKDGTGDVIISRKAWRDSDGDRQTEELGFLRITKPKDIESMLNKLSTKDAFSHNKNAEQVAASDR